LNGKLTMGKPRFVTSVFVAVLFAALFGVRAVAQTPVTREATAADGNDDDRINPDRPGIADGSTVVGSGRIQLEAGFQQEFRNDAGTTELTHFLPSLLRVGFGSRLEGRVEGNTFTQSSSSGEATQISEFAPISFGIKVRFHKQESAGLKTPSLGTILRVFPASGSGRLHTNEPTGDLRVVADWDITDQLSVNPNEGIAFYEDENGETFFASLSALTLNFFNEAGTLNPFVDFGLQRPEASNVGSSVILDAGIAYIRGRNVQIDGSVGMGPHGRTPPHLFFSVGFSKRFRASKHAT
jgi:hypothetical protein